VLLPEDRLVVRLEGFEGPLDLLLDLARRQKVDLAAVSVLALVDQYLATVERARVRLELAADWLVMAAWLTWLKSRLLLPLSEQGDDEGEEAVADLTQRLRQLDAMRAAVAWMELRPVLGHDVWQRGAPESLTEIDRSGLRLAVPDLLRAFLTARRRAAGRHQYPAGRRVTLWTMSEALGRLRQVLGLAPDWATLDSGLPQAPATPLQHRGATAGAFLAGLELARTGVAELRQAAPFAPIELRRFHGS